MERMNTKINRNEEKNERIDKIINNPNKKNNKLGGYIYG